MFFRYCMLATLIWAGCFSAMAVGEPVFLGDNNTSHSSLRAARGFTQMGDYIYFTAEGALGRELYRSDGTTAGVQLVKDICPGTTGSEPGSMVEYQGNLYFLAFDGIHGTELWKSDGTFEGTSLVKDIGPGGYYPYSNAGFTVTGNGVLFGVTNGGKLRLYRTDGTASGTGPLGDLTLTTPRLQSVGGVTYFSGKSDIYAAAGTWRSDGTEAGTTVTESSQVQFTSIAYVGDRFYLYGTGGARTGIWSTASLEQPAQFLSSASVDFTAGLVEFNGAVYFSAKITGDSDGYDLWKTDGTEAGTGKLKEIGGGTYAYLQNLLITENRLLFRAQPAGYAYGYTSTLWTSDGTEDGTVQLTDHEIGFNQLVAAGGKAYFDYADEDHGRELWVTDGTAEGTTIAVDLVPGPVYSYPADMRVTGGHVHFNSAFGAVIDSVATYNPETRQLVLQTETGSAASYEVQSMAAVGDKLYYSAWDGEHGFEPWVTDGTPEGTHLLGDLSPGEGSSYPVIFTAVGSEVYFFAKESSSTAALWKTDGTAAGTVLVKDLNMLMPAEMAVAGSELYINGAIPDYEAGGSPSALKYQLWRSNGTATGTYVVEAKTQSIFLVSLGDAVVYVDGLNLLKKADPVSSTTTNLSVEQIKVPSENSNLPRHTRLGEFVYFTAGPRFNNDFRVWKTDGTVPGTVQVLDVSVSNDLLYFAEAVNGHFFFANANGLQSVWISDGTAAGTVQVANNSWYTQSAPIGDKFIFRGNGPQGQEPWITDGTAAGTHLLRDINPSTPSFGSQPKSFTSAGGYVYFMADDGTAGYELWRTDGTTLGTVMVADLNPGSESSVPIYLLGVGDELLFSAYEPDGGWELRVISDPGAEIRTVELVPGPVSSGPSNLLLVGPHVVFQGYTPGMGADLWSLPVEDLSAVVGDWVLY